MLFLILNLNNTYDSFINSKEKYDVGLVCMQHTCEIGSDHVLLSLNTRFQKINSWFHSLFHHRTIIGKSNEKMNDQ